MEATINEAPTIEKVSTPELDAPRFSRRETLLTMLSVLAVMLLAALDQTIVGTAMPRVIADLQGFDRYTWVTTAYLLTSTVMVPIYGKLSDLLGRKPVFIFGILVFLLGSGLSGAAQSMDQLIYFRALQGFGAAALMPIAIAIVGDLFTPRERAKWQGVTGGVFALASIIGPTIGGWITDNVSWRWVFYVNLPLGLIALLLLIFVMPVLRGRAENIKIDYVGAVLLVVGVVPLLLGFTWAGSQYEWVSPQIIGLFGFAIAVIIGFFFYEARLSSRNGQPIIEPSLFKNSIFSISVLITTISSMALFGSIFFLPLFVQGVLGISITNSGLILTPLMLAAIITSVISGQIVARTGKYKLIAIAGMAVSLIGSGLLLFLDTNSTQNNVIVAMVIMGVGMGAGMSLYTLIVQNAMPTRIGQATASLTFFRSIGSTVAVSVMGSLMTQAYLPAFQNALSPAVKQAVPATVITAFNNPQILLSPDMQTKLGTQFAQQGAQGTALFHSLLDAVKQGLVQGIHGVFVLSVIITVIGLIAVFFLKEVELRGGRRKAKETEIITPEEIPTVVVEA